jgi:type I restriction enzyme S subunit
MIQVNSKAASQWPRVPFAKALSDNTAGQPKVLRRDYLGGGALAVVDQGATTIAGYTDDWSMAYRGTLPVILFGDHTRLVKYVDFPFALGADGVKALEPTPAYVAKFLYYYLVATDIPQRGYSRHFQFLREIQCPLVALSEQRRIVEILDHAEHLRRLRAGADAKADRILPALFTKMFGDPRTNPYRWQSGPLGEAIAETQYGTSERASSDRLGIAVVRMNNIAAAGTLDLSDVKFVNLENRELERLRLRSGDLLFNRTNSVELVGKTALWSGEMDAVPASYLIRIRLHDDKVCPEYIWAWMNTPFMKATLQGKARRAVGMANINATELRNLPVVFPPLERQRTFARYVHNLRELATLRLGLQRWVEQLFSLLLRRAFSGDLTASWRKAHMTDLLQEMEWQAKALPAPARSD